MPSRASMISSRTFAIAVLYSVLLSVPALAQPWRFAYMSDHRSSLGHHPGVSTTTVSRLVADMRTNQIDLVLIGGDLIHGDGQPTSDLITQYTVFKHCLDPLTNAGIPYYAIPGNHEFWAESNSWSQATDAWWQAFGQFLPQNGPTSPCPERGMTYSFNHKSALFLGVNMYTNNPTGWSYKGADTNWVQTQLAGNTKPHVFAFGHVPQTMIASNDATVQNTIDFWSLLAGARCCAYFCGHKHSYQRILTRVPGSAAYIYEVMDGSGMDVINSNGPPWWAAGNPIAVEHLSDDDTMRGYVLVEVDGLNVSLTRRCFYTNAANNVYWTNMDSFAYTADPGSNWSFAVFGDTRGNGTSWPSNPCINTPVIQAICAAITNDGALCAIAPGDLQHGQHPDGVNTNTIDHQLTLWTNAVSALGRAGIPYYAIRGNHETYRLTGSDPAHVDWTKHIGRYMPTNGPEGEIGMTYSIPYANALFIGLDTYHGTNDSGTYHLINQDWLDIQLAANARPHLFVFGHEPAVRAGISCLSENLPQRNLFWDSIGYANARAYLTGHSHIYGRCLLSISNGPALRQLIVGTGGGPLDYTWDGEYIEPAGSGATIVPEKNYTPANTYGYTIVHVSGNHVVMEYKSTTTNDLTLWTTNDVFAYTLVSTPTNVSASDGDYTDKVLVSWNPAADASGYEVWRGTNSAATSRVLISTAAGSQYSDTTAIPAVYYYYWVRATNADGASLYSNFETGWRNTPGGLPAPSGVSATQGSYTNKVRVRWMPVANASVYDVYRSLANDINTAALLASGQTVEMYDDTGTIPLQNNFYWIRARNVSSTSGFSSSAAGYRGAGDYLPPPASVSASDGLYPDKIVVSWAGVSAASEYEVWRSATNHAPLALRLAVLTATNYNDLSASQFPGASLYYWIKACNTSVTSDFSAPASGYCAPTGTAASADIYLDDFIFNPPRLRPLYHPGAVSAALGNNGPESLATPNTRVCFDFYLSSDTELHDETDIWIGDYQADISLAPAGATRIILSSAARAGLHIPELPAGLYHVFAHVRHAAPSTLVDPVPANNTAMRVGTILVDPAAASWCDGLNDLDGDGKTDLTVYQETTGLWYAILSGNGFITVSATFGGAGYTPVSGDYDGDGRTDLTVYRETTGQWNALLSGNGYSSVVVPLGGLGYTPVSSDYDGDGKTDLTVYQEVTGQWNAFLSGSGFIPVSANLGGAGYMPVSGDYDGDGKTDLMVYQETTGFWCALLSGSGFITVSATFGGAGYMPVSGDYDGDGKTDLMVYQEATGLWCALLSGSNFVPYTAIFGGSGYAPVAGDYDGDGKTDLMVYQSATGGWTVSLSGSGYASVTIPLGGTGYIPLP